jgi:Ca2+-binding RTX toxin-like protein
MEELEDRTLLSVMQEQQAWNITQGDPGTIVVELTSGIDWDAAWPSETDPTPEYNLWTNPGELGNTSMDDIEHWEPNNIDDDGNGYVDDIHGWNFRQANYDAGYDTKIRDDGHDTRGAGFVKSVAPNVSVLPVVGYPLEYIEYLTDMLDAGLNIRVITVSGVVGLTPEWQAFVERWDLLIIGGAGNDGEDVDDFYLDHSSKPNEIRTAMTWDYANDGLNPPDLRGEVLKDRTGLDNNPPSNYGATSVDMAAFQRYGTSFTGPQVAGAAALVYSVFPEADSATIRSLLLKQGDVIPTLVGKTVTGRRMNVYSTLTKLYEMLHLPTSGTVIINGDRQGVANNDVIEVHQELSDGQWHLKVEINGQVPKVIINGQIQDDPEFTQLMSDVQAIVINGIGGNDSIMVDASIDKPIRITGGAGNDTLTGGGGNDTLIGGPGSDYLNGRGGNDTADYSTSRRGVTVHLDNSPGTDDGFTPASSDTFADIENVVGSWYSDTLIGSAQGDFLRGGNIIVTLADGSAIKSGDGNDVIDGGAGNDTLIGGAGNDVLIGGTGSDSLDGGVGNDTADYSGSNYAINIAISSGAAPLGGWDGTGTDTITYLETLIGSSHDDILASDSAANLILGGEGNDLIDGGLGADTLNGGLGADTVSYASNTYGVHVTINGSAFDGTANDLLSEFENLAGSPVIDGLQGDDAANLILGGGGDDVIWGHGGNDTLVGGDGNDYLYTGRGSDSLDGGNGTDTANYGISESPINMLMQPGVWTGSHGSDTDTLGYIENVTGSDYDDTIIGDGNDNLLVGGAGNDFIRGGYGVDSINGGNGNDTVSYSDAIEGTIIDLGAQMASSDGLGFSDVLSGIENVIGGDFGDQIIGDALPNRLDGGGADDTLSGGEGDDSLIGGTGSDLIDGGDGSDTVDYSASVLPLFMAIQPGTFWGGFDGTGTGSDTLGYVENLIGGSADDTLTGDAGDNLLVGGPGNDRLSGGGSGWDRLYGDAGNDTLTGSSDSDSIEGGDGNDSILGGAGIDMIWGDAGNDTIDGGDDNDTVYGMAGDDVLTGGRGVDYVAGGDGSDTVYYAAATGPVVVDLPAQWTSSDGLGDWDMLNNIENATGGAFNDEITGDAGNNILIGGGGDDTLSGDLGDDTLDGGDGEDSLLGGAGNDALTGGLGDDLLDAGDGTDYMSGGEGNDTLYGGADTDQMYGDAGDDSMFGDDEINIYGGSAPGDLMFGGLGNDSLDGGAGNDQLEGEEGNDVLIGGADSDLLNGGDGDDTLYANGDAWTAFDSLNGGFDGYDTAYLDGCDYVYDVEDVIWYP